MVVVVASCLAACIGVSIGAPVSAQRYPPFPIGGGGGGGTGGSGNTSPKTTSGSEFFNAGGSGGGSSGGGSQTGSSSTSGDAAFSADRCLLVAGQVGNRFVLGQVQEVGALRVAGLKGCVPPFGDVGISVESTPVFLGTIRANQDGSYFGVLRLTSSIEAGQHHVVGDIEQRGELRRALQVLDSGAATVLGTSVRNASLTSTGSGGGGVLPRTGGDILKVLLWALILVGFGTLLIVATRRLAPAGASHTGRVRERRPVAALPLPEVPFIDTSRFVPSRSAPGRRAASGSAHSAHGAPATSAWDRAPRSDSPS